MSKKMLKRSLALGALMAFVITGSAMAAENNLELTVDGGKYVITNVDYTGDNYDNIILKNTNGHGLYTGTTTIVANKSITIDASQYGIDSYGKHTLVAPVINITAGEDAIHVPTDSGFGKTVIKGFDTLNVTSTNGYAIVNNGQNKQEGLTLEIVGNEGSVINLSSTDRPAIGSRAGAGNTSIEAGTLNATGDGGNKYGSVIYVAKGTELEIIVDNLNVENTGDDGNAILIEEALAGITVNEQTVVNGNIEVKDEGDLDIDFNNDKSVLNGSVKTEAGSVTKLNFNGGSWNVPEASNVTEVTGDVNIKVAKIEEGFVTVEKTDELGNLTVSSENDGTNTEEDLAALSSAVVGANKEVLADQVQLKNAIYDNVVGDVTDEGVKITEKEIASANVSVNDMVAIGMMSWRAEMNDMNKRMGELRNANGEHGVWVRMVRGESEFNSVKNQYNQYQLGYDEKLSTDPSWTVGVALSYTDAENNFAEGTGESTNKAFSVYGSKLNDDGTFVDLIAKYARLDNDFKTYSGMGDAEYDTNAYSFSAEVGKRIQQGKGLWIEPQVELTYGKVSAVDYVTDKGVNVAQDGMESLVGRIGFSLGKDIEKGNVYARASYLYDFDGETKAVLDGDAVLANDLGGGWWEVGVGANINLSKATYIYADVEKTFGGEVDTNWQWNLGVRYSF